MTRAPKKHVPIIVPEGPPAETIPTGNQVREQQIRVHCFTEYDAFGKAVKNQVSLEVNGFQQNVAGTLEVVGWLQQAVVQAATRACELADMAGAEREKSGEGVRVVLATAGQVQGIRG